MPMTPDAARAWTVRAVDRWERILERATARRDRPAVRQAEAMVEGYRRLLEDHDAGRLPEREGAPAEK